MKIVRTDKSGIVCITINSSMNGLLTSEEERALRETLKEDKNHFLFDLGALEYLKSTVLRVILDVVKETKSKNGKVVLCNLNKYVREIFDVSGDGIFLPIADSVESGVEALS
jgi:anti-anti-sigma factor